MPTIQERLQEFKDLGLEPSLQGPKLYNLDGSERGRDMYRGHTGDTFWDEVFEPYLLRTKWPILDPDDGGDELFEALAGMCANPVL